jgi:putative transcriptional regulator
VAYKRSKVVKVAPRAVARAISNTDWTRIDAMTDQDIDRQIAADPDVAPFLSGREFTAGRVRMMRRRLKLTQTAFAARFQVPVGTLRDWEQGRREPDAPALALLRIIEAEPDAALRALAS